MSVEPSRTDASETILLIDDEEAIRQVVSLSLEFEGYRVFVASNGREGLETLSRMPRPFLILLDLMMPVLDGWGFLEALRANRGYATIPVVVITAFTGDTEAVDGLESLQKPVDLDQLFTIVRKYREQARNSDWSPIGLAG